MERRAQVFRGGGNLASAGENRRRVRRAPRSLWSCRGVRIGGPAADVSVVPHPPEDPVKRT